MSAASSSPSEPTAKKYKCCARCRVFKLKCEYLPGTDPVVCKTCNLRGVECVFEQKVNEKKMIQTITSKLERIDSIVDVLVSHLAKSTDALSKESLMQALSSKSPISPMNALTSSPELNGSSTGMKRSLEDSEDAQLRKVSKKVSKKKEKELLDFFTNNISRYLPVLIFENMPKPTPKLRTDSPLLFYSILSVASLYHTEHRDLHETFSVRFEKLARKLDPSNLNNAVDSDSLRHVLDDVLGLVISGAWLGTEFGFRMSLLAGDILGRLLPEVYQDLNMSEDLKNIICSVGVASYIVEQRLRIIHNKPIMPTSKGIEFRARRDAYLPYFLSNGSNNGPNLHKLNPSELKANANVELCTIIMSYQQQLTLHGMSFSALISWNEKLNSWLADWLGKVVTSLRPSSYKPLLLTFHFAKLFLNSRVIQSHVLMEEDQDAFQGLLALAQNSAVDILEMLINHTDMQRLISVSPVFYPTTFSTAAAFLLKLLKEAPSMNYHVNSSFLMDMVGKTSHLLSEVIDSPVLPCYETVKNLGVWFGKVSSTLRTSQFLEPSRKPSPLNREMVYIPPMRNAREQTPGFDKPYFNMTLTKSGDEELRYANNITKTALGQYPSVSTPMLSAISVDQPVFDHDHGTIKSEPDDVYGNVWSFDNNDPNFLVDAQSAGIFDSLMEDMNVLPI